VGWHPKELEVEGGVDESLALVKAMIHSMKRIPESIEKDLNAAGG
jgi:hypothetical protein